MEGNLGEFSSDPYAYILVGIKPTIQGFTLQTATRDLRFPNIAPTPLPKPLEKQKLPNAPAALPPRGSIDRILGPPPE